MRYRPLSRREFVSVSVASAAALATGCSLGEPPTEPPVFLIADATLLSRPRAPTSTIVPGLHSLQVATGTRDGFLYVPSGYVATTPAPLLLLFHGAGQSSQEWSGGGILEIAEELGVIIVAPDSRGSTWDILNEARYGRDVEYVDLALNRAFQLCNVDPARVGLAGFSDGASYALSLGVINGDFLSAAIGFSPGLLYAPERRGTPGIYITHGTNDAVLPVALSRNGIVPALREDGLTVEFVEFNGGHTLPFDIAHAALTWFVNGAA